MNKTPVVYSQYNWLGPSLRTSLHFRSILGRGYCTLVAHVTAFKKEKAIVEVAYLM